VIGCGPRNIDITAAYKKLKAGSEDGGGGEVCTYAPYQKDAPHSLVLAVVPPAVLLHTANRCRGEHAAHTHTHKHTHT
jgi:hypothetical protein